MEAREHESNVAEMASTAADLKREDVLECFCDKTLRAFTVKERRKKASAAEMFARLQATVDVRAELHDIERDMDKKHFVELVTGGYFMASGVHKEKKLPAFWLDDGQVQKNAWGYKQGSPRSKAFLRYVPEQRI